MPISDCAAMLQVATKTMGSAAEPAGEYRVDQKCCSIPSNGNILFGSGIQCICSIPSNGNILFGSGKQWIYFVCLDCKFCPLLIPLNVLGPGEESTPSVLDKFFFSLFDHHWNCQLICIAHRFARTLSLKQTIIGIRTGVPSVSDKQNFN